ncbi:MAG: hypothetical protein U0805_04175 [Pirellulales bacterium]
MVLHIESSIAKRATARLEACIAPPTSMSAEARHGDHSKSLGGGA